MSYNLQCACVYKEVGGYLTRRMHIEASITLTDESLVTQSVTYIGIELLGQLKSKRLLLQDNLVCFVRYARSQGGHPSEPLCRQVALKQSGVGREHIADKRQYKYPVKTTRSPGCSQ